MLLQPHGQESAEYASEIRRQKRHPSEQGDLLQVHVPDAAQIQRQPEAQRAPGRISQKARKGDPPEVALAEDLEKRRARTIALQVLFLALGNVLPLLLRKCGVPVRRLIQYQPERHPDQPQAAGNHKRHSPVVSNDGPGDQRGRQHGTHRGSDVIHAARQSAFLGGKPVRGRLHASGVGRTFSKAEKPAKPGKCLPGSGQGMRHIHQRPRDRKNREPHLQAEHIQHVPADWLRHDGALKGANDPGILLGGDVQFLEQCRGGYREHASGQVVDDRAEHNQADHPPSKSSDLDHRYSPGGIRNSQCSRPDSTKRRRRKRPPAFLLVSPGTVTARIDRGYAARSTIHERSRATRKRRSSPRLVAALPR